MKSLVLIAMLTFSCAYAGFNFKEKDLANLYSLCNKGDGKYSACTKLTDILSKHCDGGNAEKCGELGYVLYEIGKAEESIVPLQKACDADLAFYCLEFGKINFAHMSDLKRALYGFDKVCRLGTDSATDRQRSCIMKDEIRKCLRDAECNPLKMIQEVGKKIRDIK